MVPSRKLAIKWIKGPSFEQTIRAGGAKQVTVVRDGIVGTIDEWDGEPTECRMTKLSMLPTLLGRGWALEREPHWADQLRSYCWLTRTTTGHLIPYYENGVWNASRCPSCGRFGQQLREVRRRNERTGKMARYCPECPDAPLLKGAGYDEDFMVEDGIFTEEEVEEWGKVLLDRKQVLEKALETGRMPDPTRYCYYTWLCATCEVGPAICCSMAGAGSLTGSDEEGETP